MDRRFILPISLAAAFHVSLLFGFRRGPAPTPPPKVVDKIEITRFENPPEEIPKVETPPDSSAPRGRPDKPMPMSQDTPSVTPGPFTVPLKQLMTIDVKNMTRIERGPIGLPEGVDGGDLRSLIVGSLALDDPPRTRLQVPPLYPYEAKREGRGGEVFVEFIVDEGGRVLNPRVINSTDRTFEEPTLNAIAKWRFEPGRVRGKIVRFKMAVPVKFNLNDADGDPRSARSRGRSL